MPLVAFMGEARILRCFWLLVLAAVVACGGAAGTDTPPPATATSMPASTATPETPKAEALSDATSIEGRWEGANHIAGVELAMIIRFTLDNHFLTGNIQIPSQGADLPLNIVTYSSGKVHFELESPLGTAAWDGELLESGIEGEFNQAGVTGTFQLTRSEGEPPAPVVVDLPYDAEEVTFQNGDITLAGTLTLPPGAGPHPAVVLVTGSGPQNRDEELVGFKIFGVIADYLTRQGIAVLRYDDRGVGGSSGEILQATLPDFAADVQAGVDLLKSRPDIDPAQIGLVGHSEGGIVAALVGAESDGVAFMVLIAGTAVPGDAILHAQLQLIMEAGKASEEEVAQALENQAKTLDAVRTGEGWDAIEADARSQILESLSQLTETQRAAITDTEKYVDTIVKQQLASVRSPWFKSFVEHDPGDSIRQLTVPILALFGGLDLQVPVELNRTAMVEAAAAAGNSGFSTRTFPEANHLFQRAITGSPNEYAALDKEFVPGFLQAIGDWILERVRLPAP